MNIYLDPPRRLTWLVWVALLLCTLAEAQTCDTPSVIIMQGFLPVTELSPGDGSRVTLTCSVDFGSSSSPPSVDSYLWKKNGDNLVPPGPLQQYTISSFQTGNGGLYRCGVLLSCSSDPVFSSEVIINAQAVITQLVGDSMVTEGESFQLTCTADGWPEPSIQWFHPNGSLIHTGSVYTNPSASLSDGGEYTCSAFNSRGMDDRMFMVTVEALPVPSTTTLQSPSAVTTTTTSSLHIQPTTLEVQMATKTTSGSQPDETNEVPPSQDEEDDSPAPLIVFVVVLAVSGVLIAFTVLLMGLVIWLCFRDLRKKPPQRTRKLTRGGASVSDEIKLLEEGPDGAEATISNQENIPMVVTNLSGVNKAFAEETSSTDEEPEPGRKPETASAEPGRKPETASATGGQKVQPQRYSLNIEDVRGSSKKGKGKKVAPAPRSVSMYEPGQKKRQQQQRAASQQRREEGDPREARRRQQQQEERRREEGDPREARRRQQQQEERRREKGAARTRERASAPPQKAAVRGQTPQKSRPVSSRTQPIGAERREDRKSSEQPVKQEPPADPVQLSSPGPQANNPTVTVTTFRPDVSRKDETETRTTSIVITEKEGETTVAMQEEMPSEMEEDVLDVSSSDEDDEQRLIPKRPEDERMEEEGKEDEGTEEDEEEGNEVTEEANITRMSVFIEKAKKMGRSVSFVKQLDRSHPLNLVQIRELIDGTDEELEQGPPLKVEYHSVPFNSVQTLPLSLAEKQRNRYRNVLPNPHSAVKLKDTGEDGSTYINANYIRGVNGTDATYIAAQGPTENTVSDFWRMVWENNVTIIVMITGLIERGTTKCARYWPSADDPEPASYGDFTIRNNFEENATFYKIAYLSLYPKDQAGDASAERDVYHFWHTAWPDFGVPRETISIMKLHEAVTAFRSPEAGPLVVHCSAGLGRTGTFMAIDMGIEQYESEGIVDPLKYMCEMRQDRGGIVQTPEQYTFIHKALADYMVSRPK